MSKQYFDAEGQSVNQFGTPAAPVAGQPSYGQPPAGSVPAPYGQAPFGTVPQTPYAGYAPQRPGMSTGAKVAIALGSAVAGLVILGILAAIAIPVFLNQRAKAAADGITISLPGQIAAYPRMTGAADAQVQSLVTGLPPEAGTAQGAAYGVGQPSIIVIAGSHVMIEPDRTSFLNGVAKSEARAGVIQVPVDPGPLGGQMRCGPAIDGSRTDCAFADAGAYGVIDVAVTGSDALPLVQQVRAAVETHR
jgi:hypothetical protein